MPRLPAPANRPKTASSEKTHADRLGDCDAERAETDADTVARPTASAPTDATNEPPS